MIRLIHYSCKISGCESEGVYVTEDMKSRADELISAEAFEVVSDEELDVELDSSFPLDTQLERRASMEWRVQSFFGNPKRDGLYLVTVQGTPRTAFPAIYTKGVWEEPKGVRLKAKVIAWTPLPEAYEGDV